MNPMRDLLHDAAERGVHYRESLGDRRVFPAPEAIAALDALDTPFPAGPTEPERVLATLDELGSPATAAQSGGRYFGFVTGSSLPITLAANWMAGAWDQNAALVVMSPIAAKLEVVAQRWVLDALGLPEGSAMGFVTGATMANFSALAAARHALLAKQGWDAEAQGLFGAPPITVIVGEEVHSSLLKALALVGFGRRRVVTVPADGQGRMRADALPAISGPTIICVQAGNVNTGSFDPCDEIIPKAHEAGAWVHVDGAFGLWAAAAPLRASLTAGLAEADSWATDAHKWLNAPYDSGLVIVRQPEALQGAMAQNAAYLLTGTAREPMYMAPEMSRRARGIEIWAALSTLGRSGLADLIERACQQATRFAEGLRAAGYQVLNDVVINQVLVSFGEAERTQRVIAALQADGTCFCGGTVWQGHTAMRISVSSYATTDDDVERSLAAMIRVAKEVGA